MYAYTWNITPSHLTFATTLGWVARFSLLSSLFMLLLSYSMIASVMLCWAPLSDFQFLFSFIYPAIISCYFHYLVCTCWVNRGGCGSESFTMSFLMLPLIVAIIRWNAAPTIIPYLICIWVEEKPETPSSLDYFILRGWQVEQEYFLLLLIPY